MNDEMKMDEEFKAYRGIEMQSELLAVQMGMVSDDISDIIEVFYLQRAKAMAAAHKNLVMKERDMCKHT